MNRELSDHDRVFLDQCRSTVNLERYGDFVLRWAQALESYGTPREFPQETRCREIEVDFYGQSVPVVYVSAPNNAQRRELMARQKPYVPQERTEEYFLRLDLDHCFLCQNVVQGIDASNHSDDVVSNVIFDLGGHYILPNRYPQQYGHSLSIPKDHDNLTTRVTPVSLPEQKTTAYYPEHGKTRGKVLTADYLNAVVEACDKFHLTAIRNHVLDAMSIPGHDHFHLQLEDATIESLVARLTTGIGQEQTEFGSNVYRLRNTPFDTLMISAVAGKDLISTAAPLLEKMEREDEIFTLRYQGGQLLVSPRRQEKVNHQRIQVGGGIPIHVLDTEGPEFIERIKVYVPVKGEFKWERYFT